MSLIVAHNLSAINANRQSNLIERKRTKVMEQLSSGYRINRAADDASGLAISEKMRAQIRGLSQASHNIQDGISYVQTADGALEEVHSIFQRIREISVQASNGTNTSFDRLMLDLEIDELKDNAERIFKDTEFNTQKIWDGEPLLVNTIVGTASVPAVSVSSTSVESTITNTNRLVMPKNGFRLNADTDGIQVSWTAYDGNTYTSELIEWEEPLSGTHSFHLKDYLNNVTYTDKTTNTVCVANPMDFEGLDFIYTYTVAETAMLDDAITALNNAYVSTSISTPESAKTFTVDGSNLGTTADGNLFHVSCSANIYYDALLVSDRDFEASDTVYIEGIKNSNGEYENVSNHPVTDNTPSEAFEFEFLLKTGTDASGNDIFTKVKTKPSHTNYYCHSNEKEDENIWWHTVTYDNGHSYTYTSNYQSSPGCSPDSISNAYSTSHSNKTNTKTETLEEANKTHTAFLTYSFSLVAENKFTCKDGSQTDQVGSISITLSVPSNPDRKDTADKINEALGKLSGLDIYSNDSHSRLYSSVSSWNSPNRLDVPTYEPCYEYAKCVDIQAGANEGQIIPVDYAMLSLSLLDIEDIQVDTLDHAQDALKRIDDAIRIISEQRSLFGAYQNRLEYAKAIDDNTGENLQAAESTIRDADMASSMVIYSKIQILSQTAQSMLAQANQSKQAVLELLQQ